MLSMLYLSVYALYICLQLYLSVYALSIGVCSIYLCMLYLSVYALSICLCSIYRCMLYLSVYSSIYLSMLYLSILYLSIIYLSIYLSIIYLSIIYLSIIYLSIIYLSIYRLFDCLSINDHKNPATHAITIHSVGFPLVMESLSFFHGTGSQRKNRLKKPSLTFAISSDLGISRIRIQVYSIYWIKDYKILGS